MKPPNAVRDRWSTLTPWVAAALVLAVLVTFATVFRADFVDWDDPRNLVDNPHWHGFTADNLRWMFTTAHMGHYHPVTWLSFALDHALSGGSAAAMHVTSVVLHAATALAVFAFARRLFASAAGVPTAFTARGRLIASGFAAAVFALHPLRCESVCWLTERRDVLAGLFSVLALSAWVRRANGDAPIRHYVAALLFYVLAWASKGTAVVLPAIFVLLDAWPLRRWSRENAGRLVRDLVPFGVLAAVMTPITLWAAASAGSTLKTVAQHGLATRVAQATYGALFYPAKTLVPIDLRPIYVVPDPFEPFSARFVLAMVGFAGLTIALVRFRKRAPALLAAWIAYLVLLAPVSGLLQAGPQLVAERYSYVACIPFALLAGFAFAWCAERAFGIAISAAFVVVAALGVMTSRQAATWVDSSTMWQRTLDVDALNPHALLHSGTLLYRAALVDADPERRRAALGEAARRFELGMTVSHLPQLRVNEALVHGLLADSVPDRRRAELERALALCNEAFDLSRATGEFEPMWWIHRAGFLFKLDRADEARADLERFVAAVPDEPQGYRTLAAVDAALGLAREREIALTRLCELEPGDATARVQLGISLEQRGESEPASRRFDEARALVARGAPISADMRRELERRTAGSDRR